jgi:DNA-binding NtrC family response regulator
MKTLEEGPFSLVLLDLSMPNVSGEELLPLISERHPDISVLVITARSDLETVVSCWRAGAKDYIIKPVDPPRLIAALENAFYVRLLQEENFALKQGLLEEEIKNPTEFHEIVSAHTRMKSIFIYMEAIAKTPYPILITGENGTGKELIARCLYRLSGRKGKFVAVNLAGLDDALFSDALFGHSRGAFTGADKVREGFLHKAENGVIFLDEIGDIENSSQQKLLRLLQESEFHPLGSDKTERSNARIIIATNSDLERNMKIGEFRMDLFYRLNTHRIHLPPLRERLSDLPLLLDHFIRKHAKTLKKSPPPCPEQLADMLAQYDFPGNIRELENMAADAVAMANDGEPIPTAPFSKAIKGKAFNRDGKSDFIDAFATQPDSIPTLEEVEQKHIASVLKLTNNNLTQAAEILGIGYSTLHRKLKKISSGQNDQNKLK